MNAKDERIAKWWRDGASLERIAAKLGAPDDVERVRAGLRRCGLLTEEEEGP